MSYTRQDWFLGVLANLGNLQPHEKILQWGVNWTVFETSTGSKGALYNLLNTTQRESGSTDFNSAGVQNFTSFMQGTRTNAIVLSNGFYPWIFATLRMNDPNKLTNYGEIDKELSIWGTQRQGDSGLAFQLLQMTGHLTDEFPGIDDSPPRPAPATGETYVIQPGDTLFQIAARFPMSERALFALNQSTLDNAAKERGQASSNNGNLIFPGTIIEL